jgi:hypothetical protein
MIIHNDDNWASPCRDIRQKLPAGSPPTRHPLYPQGYTMLNQFDLTRRFNLQG